MSKKRKAKARRKATLTKAEKAAIDECVGHFEENAHLFQHAANSLMSAWTTDSELGGLIHFIKHRLKNPMRLRDKLRKNALAVKQTGKKPDITVENLFERLTDLAGVRILHLYTDQIERINSRILSILEREKYALLEGPTANIWDNEADVYFKSLGFKTNLRETMYTSVHYIIGLNTASGVRCELQVRTLADEVWGEVSHTIDYPEPTESIACKEQLKVLARVTSGCTRLVDSIFRSREEFDSW